ncbi:MAG: AAA family ATPase, partial [Chromatiales bacterium]
MYESHFGLSERPFSIAPDPRYVYLSQAHEDALAHLLYGVGEGGGFVQLTGEVGTGKTTLIRSLVDQLPANVDLALIFNPRLSPRELVATVCDELHIPYPEGASLKDLIDRLNERLLASFAAGRRIVLIIDEAQALDPDVLEQVRLLTNLETTREKLLQIVLVGQPELRDALARPELRQLAQRITARYHLEPLSIEDTRNYVLHRLNVAGAKRPLFSDPAIREIQRSSGGVPRLTNVIADRSLLGA